MSWVRVPSPAPRNARRSGRNGRNRPHHEAGSVRFGHDSGTACTRAPLAPLVPVADATATMDERTPNCTANGGVSGAADTWPLSAREAAAALGVSERTVRRAIARGELPAAMHAGTYRIAPAALAPFRRRLTAPT